METGFTSLAYTIMKQLPGSHAEKLLTFTPKVGLTSERWKLLITIICEKIKILGAPPTISLARSAFAGLNLFYGASS